MSTHQSFDRIVDPGTAHRWIGAAPSVMGTGVFLFVGSVALLIAGVQPIVLGALVDAHRLSVQALGWTVTVELLSMGLAAGFAGAKLPPKNLKKIGCLAALALALLDFAIIHQSGVMVIVDRTLAGVAEGILLWLTGLMIARSLAPARWSAIFLVTQAVLQVSFSSLIPIFVLPVYGADGGFLALAGTALAAALVAPALPSELARLGSHSDSRRRHSQPLPWPAIASLVAVFAMAAYLGGLLAYLQQLAEQAHMSPQQSGVAISLLLVGSISGSAAAAGTARLVCYFEVFWAAFLVNLLVIAILATLPRSGIFMVTTGVFGFTWGYLQPFQAPFLIAFDASRRAVLLFQGAVLLGMAVGPLLCSFFVTDTETRGALAVSGACLVIAIVIPTALQRVCLKNIAQVSPTVIS